MIKTAGNRVFARLSSILNLPGTQNLGKIDIDVAQPVYPLREVVESELIIPAFLGYDFTIGPGATTVDFAFDPFETATGEADSRTIAVSQARGSQPVLDGLAVDRDWDAYLLDFGVQFEDAGGAGFPCALYQEWNSAFSPPDPPQFIRILWSGTINKTLGLSDRACAISDTRVNARREFPIRMPNEAWGSGSTDQMWVNVTGSPAGAELGSCGGRLILVRKGVIPVFP